MVELLCTLTGIISGVALVTALMQQQGERRRFEARDQQPLDDETESLKGITNQLQILTSRVAADVSAHTQKVFHINERLMPAKNEPERIISAITDLIQANESMHGQLAAAQQRLSKQSEQIEATARQARTDALTGLANRRALEETLKDTVESLSSDRVFGLLLVDIDHFKTFNDSYGHTTGDAVLSSFARSIAKWSAGRYYAARYGGEEFAVILSADSIDELPYVAAEVRKFISEQVIEHEDLRLTVTASGGMTVIQPGDTIKSVYERADEGLYRSKKTGRNRGFWLDDAEWRPFPTGSKEAADASRAAAKRAAARALAEGSATDEPLTEDAETAASVNSGQAASLESAKIVANKHLEEIREHLATSAVNDPHGLETHEDELTGIDDSDVLDLSAFVERLEAQLKQLNRAQMPAVAIMIEAVGLTPDKVRNFDRSWRDVMNIVQANLRGIDIICRLRHNTLCVFMPGLTLKAALARAGGMQHLLEESREGNASSHYPERFAIAAAATEMQEEAGAFMQRLEEALEEAQDASTLELVVSEANSSYFHAT